VTVDLDGVRTKADFEVIEIVDDTTPYPTLLGLDWAFDNQAIINLKTRKMTFESGGIQGHRTIRPIRRGKVCRTYLFRLRGNHPVVQNKYARDEDYVNPTADGILSWQKHYFMCDRLRYRFRKLATKATRSFHKKVCKNRPRSKMGRHEDKGTTQFPWSE
jgi:hypothetical protein